MKRKHKIEYRQVADLIPYANNSRTHSEEQVAQIAASIREFGFTNPLLIDEGNGIIAGHGRLMAARKLGMEEVPCIVISGLTEAQKKALVIADNKLALNADWDEEMLAAEIERLMEMDYDVSLLGFDDDELGDLVKEVVEAVEGLTDDDDVPEVQDEPVSEIGDVWVLDGHRLMCGDSTNAEHVSQLMGGNEADMVWTDPPYNVAVSGKAGTIMNDDMASTEFKKFLDKVYKNYFNAMRAGAVIYVAHSEAERASFTECFVDAGFKFSQALIWVKQSATLSRQDFNWRHEPIIYGWKEGEGHYFCGDFKLTTVIDDDIDIESLKKEQLVDLLKEIRRNSLETVIRHDRPTRSDLHPTMKPVSLVSRMIEWSSKPGDSVLDLFGGSGSTLIACEKTGRKAFLMELDPKFSDVIVRRWQDFTGRKAIHEQTGKTFDEVANERAR